ncbi:hypothetical protein DPEC_G00317470 [Dallia pectoralis]|uniref:Uncharacterized protein n=1 Tax=Dallia pectoralis TaxID=75939 RepID=A0ACC2FCU7_DALPE|nr:hypothetical protein DPEC_G00317470 [Dallia pectoralis]
MSRSTLKHPTAVHGAEASSGTTMKKRHRHTDRADEPDTRNSPAAPLPVLPPPHSALTPSTSGTLAVPLPSPATRRSISMGDFRRVTAALYGSQNPPASATAPSSKMVTPSSSMEFQAARRRLLEMEERQRVIREMERHLEELREVFVRSEQEAVEHGEVVTRTAGAAEQGEAIAAENSQRLKKGLRFKKHRPTIVFSSMLGLRTCLPWPVKLK